MNNNQARCRALDHAIRKYGEDSFEINILFHSVPMSHINFWEELCIKIYDTLSPKGYNLTTGGSNGFR